MTGTELFRQLQQQLQQGGISDSRFEAQVLLEEVTGKRGVPPFLQTTELTASQLEKAEDFVNRRLAHEPLQYLCGTWEFFGMELQLNHHVLIPRQDTEKLVETVLKLRAGQPATRLLDLCAGSGCIPCAIGANLQGVTGCCVELSDKVLPVLQENIKHYVPQIQVVQGDATAELPEITGQFDCITCNPPYLTAQDMEEISPEVAQEPAMALFGGADGLDFYRKITKRWANRLTKGGYFIYEIGLGQQEAVGQLMIEQGFQEIRYIADDTGKIRDVVGRKD